MKSLKKKRNSRLKGNGETDRLYLFVAMNENTKMYSSTLVPCPKRCTFRERMLESVPRPEAQKS